MEWSGWVECVRGWYQWGKLSGMVLVLAGVWGLGVHGEEARFSVRLEVVDGETGEVIEKVRVLPASFAAIPERRATWQSQYAKELEGEEKLFEMARGWESIVLRVEAEGYKPGISEPLPTARGLKTRVKLQQDAGIRGVILKPNGEPAVGASVGLATYTCEVTVTDGELEQGGHGVSLRPFSKTGEDGSFHLAGECDDWLLVFAHPEGYLEVTEEEYQRLNELRLESWGRIEGELTAGYEPLPGIALRATGRRKENCFQVSYYSSTSTDDKGAFRFERIPAKKILVQPVPENENVSTHYPRDTGQVELEPGITTKLTLPRLGRTLKGKILLPDTLATVRDVLEVTINIDPEGEFIGGLVPRKIVNGRPALRKSHEADRDEFLKTTFGKMYERKGIRPDNQGNFLIEDLPEGGYMVWFFVRRKSLGPEEPDEVLASARETIFIKVLTDRNEFLDLGEIKLQEVKKNPSGE